MPRPRLPWFKVWVGATRHGKIVSLSDKSFRVWVELLDAASEQKMRGRFDSVKAAAQIIRRKEHEVQAVVDGGLMDATDSGVWMHDWKDWQRWRPEDAQANDSDSPPEDHLNGSGITHESLRNGSNKPRIKHRKTQALARAGEDVDVDVDREGDVDVDAIPPVPTGHPPTRGRRRVTEVDDVFRLELEDQFSEAFGSRQAVRDVIDNAMSDKALLRKTDHRAYLRNWVRSDAERAVQRRKARGGFALIDPVLDPQPELVSEPQPAYDPNLWAECPDCGTSITRDYLLRKGSCSHCRAAKMHAQKGA